MKDDGGPAFPTEQNTEHFSHPSTIYRSGMSLREFFAAKALPAVYTEAVREMNAKGYPCPEWRYGIALDAYAMADAMLAARGKP